jgi:5-methyltetrahydrofolate--homocysteine methyltransferase
MNIVGERFKNHEVYIPEVILSARAMKMGMEVLKPALVAKNVENLGVAVIATVKGDLHDIGKNLVCMMLEGAGFEVIDLGIDVPEEKIIKEVNEKQANILGLSALLTTTMPAIKEVISALKASGLRNKVKVMVGGAPVTQEYANQVGADGYASNAALAVDRAKELLG